MRALGTHEGEARAGKKRSETGKKVSSRAFDARSAGLPNLGTICGARRKGERNISRRHIRLGLGPQDELTVTCPPY